MKAESRGQEGRTVTLPHLERRGMRRRRLSALGEGGEQTAPLGRSVIGGLAASTIAVLTILPLAFVIVQRRAGRGSVSIHPEDAGARVEDNS